MSKPVSLSTYREENGHGVMKTRCEVAIGTQVFDVPKRLKNPLTERYVDLTNLSTDGYCLPFIVAMSRLNRQNAVDLNDQSPVLAFDPDCWEWRENEDGHLVVTKRDPDSTYGEMLLGEAE